VHKKLKETADSFKGVVFATHERLMWAMLFKVRWGCRGSMHFLASVVQENRN
jgi:hypothetical protein